MFSKKHAATPRQSVPMASTGSTFSVIGSDVTIKGDITASADLHIDGQIEGDIACASLVQGESSHIAGAISAESARIGGAVTGSITARELVVLQNARIEGDVHYDTLTIEQGAAVEGRFAHRETGKHHAVEPALPDDDSEPKLHIAS
ncbi:polymer-forming cytoskeletal protein [Tsuneonella suprasediminis]|uniref:Polymer-forming cytoskeletal protein n=2 Tax=Tsuneonella suprasediminis TaxID=2306996 RepID=A0A419QY04_9SPHN|nr:polymer-forming cytoskeletal protein [Tsuneonella suprasediminis]